MQRIAWGLATLVGVLAALLPAGAAQAAPDDPPTLGEPMGAGLYRVALCKARPFLYAARPYYFMGYSRRHRMSVGICAELQPGQRGLITSSVAQRSGGVPSRGHAQIVIHAPPGTVLRSLHWGAIVRRTDCRYAAELQARAPGLPLTPLFAWPANRMCGESIQQVERFFAIPGARSIHQFVICEPPRRRGACAARPTNYIRTSLAELVIRDGTAPEVSILPGGPLVAGAWVNGTHDISYDATDNTGVRLARAVIGTDTGDADDRPCAVVERELNGGGVRAYANGVPCLNGPRQFPVETENLPEGTGRLQVEATDAAGNVARSAPVTVRIDRTAPERITAVVDGGEGWRNRPDFAVLGAGEAGGHDRAPIAAAHQRLCRAGARDCVDGERTGGDISPLRVQVPAPGEWSLQLWQRDAAGNSSAATPSEPVSLRYDPVAPSLAFEPTSTDDPTLVGVRVDDELSGVAGGSIELSREGSGIWQALPTQLAGTRLTARIDDAALPAGTYVLRASAADHATNQATTDRRADGQPMAVMLPLRATTTMRAGIAEQRVVRRIVRRGDRRRIVRSRVTRLRPTARVAHDRRVRVSGQIVTSDGRGIAGAPVEVHAIVGDGAPQRVTTLHADGDGRYGYTTTGAMSRTLRFAYPGTARILPAHRDVRLWVPASTSIRVSRPFALNGQAVTFRGRLRTQPVPPGGKLIELQVRLTGRWQTFRTTHTDDAGRYAVRYRFLRVRGRGTFRFRIWVTREFGYPFTAGASRSVDVAVRGR